MSLIPKALACSATLLCLAYSNAGATSVQSKVDEQVSAISAAASEVGLSEIVEIDHARLAKAEGVEMPPSRVVIVSNPEINTPLLSQNIRVGLDLPLRVLSYSDDGEASAITTTSDFLVKRHGVPVSSDTASFDQTLEALLAKASVEATAASTEGLAENFGILELASEFDFDTTVQNLRSVVMAQDDTVWFGEIDYTAEAEALGVMLPRSTLLLFGGPAPGGVAMAKFPAIGLDAFCQKLLVYEDNDGKTRVIYNDIAALAELHYASSAEPHHQLNKRLTATFTGAVEK